MYIEPFGGVAVEAMMCGTPVITSDWGAFTETVQHGKTGYRCRTLDDYIWAAEHISNINPMDCREWAVNNYSAQRVALMYDEFFHKVLDLWGDGWYSQYPQRDNLDWLKKEYV
jgi:glycosyltransferase involved in cell wall biosynthesis